MGGKFSDDLKDHRLKDGVLGDAADVSSARKDEMPLAVSVGEFHQAQRLRHGTGEVGPCQGYPFSWKDLSLLSPQILWAP